MFNVRNDSSIAGTQLSAQNAAQFRPGNTTSSSYNFGTSSSAAMAANDSSQQQQQQEGQQFAPSFLFGNQQPSNRRSFGTPTRHVIPGYGGSPSLGILKREAISGSGGSGSTNKNVHWSPQLVRERNRSKSPPEERKKQRLAGSNSAGKSGTANLWNGPPLRSLNDDIIGCPPAEKVQRMEQPDPMLSVSTQPFPLSQSELRSREEEMVEMDEQQDDQEGIYWVTVFGFGAGQREEVLELFARHGDIMAQKTPKHEGANWVHIRYSSPVHAKQALAKNATLFRGNMIGVTTCKDREALDDEAAAQATTPLIPQSKTANRSHLNGSLLEHDNSLLLNGSRLVPSTSAYRASIGGNTSLPSRARLSISSRAGMRPLNSSFISTDGEQQHNQSLDSSSFHHNKSGASGHDDSFMGKLWSMFTTTGAGTGS